MWSPSNTVSRVDQWIGAIDRVVMALGLIAVSASASLLFLGVIARYIFQKSYSTFEELSVNLVVWAVMILGGPVFWRGGHVGMDFLSGKLHGSGKAAQKLLISVALFFLCAIFFWKGLEIVQMIYLSNKTTVSGDLKEWYLKMAVPLGGFLFGLYALGEMIKGVCLFFAPELAEQVSPAQPTEHPGQEGPGK